MNYSLQKIIIFIEALLQVMASSANGIRNLDLGLCAIIRCGAYPIWPASHIGVSYRENYIDTTKSNKPTPLIGHFSNNSPV